MSETLSLYKKKWGIEELTYSQFKDVCAEVPAIHNTIRTFLLNCEELKGMGSEISRIKNELKEKLPTGSFLKWSLKEHFDDLEKMILKMTRETQAREELVNTLGEVERNLQISNKSILIRMNSIEELSKKWACFLKETKLSLNLDEPSIHTFLQNF